MARRNYYSLHPLEEPLQGEFQYGNMRVARKPLDKASKPCKRLISIFESYLRAGVFPENTRLIGDYLEHTLIKGAGEGPEIAGRYLGVALPNGNYQYLRLDGESIGVQKHKLEPPEEIDILTDTCLFCAANATATLKTGEVVSIVAPKTKIDAPIQELHISERMCLYEMDAVVRLSDLISSMIQGSHKYRRVFMAMPTVEYYFYLMGDYNRGFVEKWMMQEWISQINRHAEKIVRAISKRANLDIERCQPLGSVDYYIKECVDKGKAADFEKVKGVLSQEQRLWRDLLPIAKPKDWKDLNYISYIISVLDCASVRSAGNRLTIDIENPSEQRVLRNAAKIARKLEKQGSENRFSVFGIYPHEKVFIPDGQERCKFQRLYYLEQNKLAGECYYKGIIEANRRKLRR